MAADKSIAGIHGACTRTQADTQDTDTHRCTHRHKHTHSLTHPYIHTNAPVDVLANSEMAVESQPSLRDFFERVASDVECFRFVARVLSQEEEDEAEDEGEKDANLFAVLVVWSRFSGFAAFASILPEEKDFEEEEDEDDSEEDEEEEEGEDLLSSFSFNFLVEDVGVKNLAAAFCCACRTSAFFSCAAWLSLGIRVQGPTARARINCRICSHLHFFHYSTVIKPDFAHQRHQQSFALFYGVDI